MFIASYSHTMANARAKIEEDGKPRFVDFAALRRQRAADEANERRRKYREAQARLSDARRSADDSIKAANEALARLHREWAEAENRQVEMVTALRNRSVQEIARRICYWTGVSEAEVFSPRREVRIVLVRQAIAYWACRLTSKSLPEIGRILGRDHTTLIHGKRAYVAKRKAMRRNLREAR